jgi:hypothetical protein
MSRNWDIYDRGHDRTPPGGLYVSMNSKGEIVLNAAAFEKLGAPKAVTMMFDMETSTIGLRPTSPLMPNAHPVALKEGNRRRVGAPGFVRKYDIKLDGTIKFRTPAIEDGILVLDLKKISNASRKGFSKRR